MGHALILGAGKSAVGASKILLRLGHSLTVSDITCKYPDQIEALRSLGVEIIIGPQDRSLLEQVDRVIVSPGLHPDIPILDAARTLGIPIESEIDLALRHYKGSVIGITGTNGKSTTTMLISHLLQDLGMNAPASGNIGVPPSAILADNVIPDALILELSSYQLDFSEPITNICSLFTSFSEDHMERHKSMEAYFAAKWKLIEATLPNGLCIMPRKIVAIAQAYGMRLPQAPIVQIVVDDEQPMDWATGPIVKINSRKMVFGGDGIQGVRHIPKGISYHNQINLVMAALATQVLKKTPWPRCTSALKGFSWLPYRFECIGTIQKQPVYNDSKSTNIESTQAALKSIATPCLLLVGGHPKGEDFSPLMNEAEKIKLLVVFGAAGPQISKSLSQLNPLRFDTLHEALSALPSLLGRSPIPIVFSPGCSSFDEFRNFEERGEFFNQKLIPQLD